jgi:Sigma-70, region 4
MKMCHACGTPIIGIRERELDEFQKELSEDRDKLEWELSRLSKRERFVFTSIIGIDTKRLKQRAVAKLMGLSVERVRQLYASATLRVRAQWYYDNHPEDGTIQALARPRLIGEILSFKAFHIFLHSGIEKAEEIEIMTDDDLRNLGGHFGTHMGKVTIANVRRVIREWRRRKEVADFKAALVKTTSI